MRQTQFNVVELKTEFDLRDKVKENQEHDIKDTDNKGKGSFTTHLSCVIHDSVPNPDKIFSLQSEFIEKIEGFDTTYEVLLNGSGERIVEGNDCITLHSVGYFSDGREFFSTKENLYPLQTMMGCELLPRGFEAGLQGLKLGEKR